MEAVLRKLDEVRWELPKNYKQGMRVPGLVFATEKLVKQIEARALEQLANVAMLPGIYKYSIAMPDIHEGYGFPIGGVAAFDAHEGIVSPGGVGYDINCLSPDSEVLTEHGSRIKLKDLPKRPQGLRVYDAEEGHNDYSDLLFVAVRGTDELAFRLITETGRSLEGSADHPVLTPEGYKSMSELKRGDIVVIYPFEGVEHEERSGVLLDENAFDDLQVRSYLKNRNLLPLRWEDPRLGTIARLFGFAMGNGHLSEMFGRLYLSFYGSEHTLEGIRKDLERIGVKASPYVKRKELRVASSSFALLMEKLGMPRGEKVGTRFSVPRWVREAPLWIKRNFLAGLFGADGSIPILKSYTPLPINLTQCKRLELEEDLLSYLKDIKELLMEFGIVSSIYSVERNERNVTYKLTIEGEDDVRNFLGKIGYEYDPRKKEMGLWAYAYLLRKKRVKDIRIAATETAKRVHKRSRSLRDVYDSVKSIVNRRFNSKSLKGFPTFKEFVEAHGLRGGMVIERVERVEVVEPSYSEFYDLGVDHRAHNFIANGLVVHNCGVRLIRTDLNEEDVRPKLKQLVDAIFENVPSGLGSSGKVRLSPGQLDEVIMMGAKWAVEQGYGWERDLDHCEEGGMMEGADPNVISRKAKERGAPQLGSLGSGNHFLEVQVVDKVYDAVAAKVMGIEREGQVVAMVHTGSRGFGHQVADDFLNVMLSRISSLNFKLPDKELIFAYANSDTADKYFKAMKGAANYAWANRQMVTHWVREAFERVFGRRAEDMGMELVYDVAHNIAKLEEHLVDGRRVKVYVHRKGATRSFPPGHPAVPSDYREMGQPVIIPGSQGTASYLMTGTARAMEESFGTAAHGAGRVMSREQAKRIYRGSQIVQMLAERGIILKPASLAVAAEEAPGAYKNVDEVVNATHKAGIAKLVARLVPIGVVKG
ncbi:MAG: intein-containing RctB family protein [Candidatus Korarchaeum sp.]|nr:intein-containing RctB family protein [Candidatus Korarchaeum sp.]MDW8036395.1 intein-containing RctB family protein [Candidatus Korarchaeum sp.]